MKVGIVVLYILSVFFAFVGGIIYSIARQKEIVQIDTQRGDGTNKYISFFDLMDKWMRIKEDNKNLKIFFDENAYERIAIYGLGKIGSHLVTELKKTNINIVYVIDKRADALYINDIPVKTMNDPLENVDVVVVTAFFEFDSIKKDLKSKLECPVISLEEIIDIVERREM